MAREHDQIIRASEIGEYLYCGRAWWLRRVAGWEPAGAEQRARGTRLHQRHGRTVRASAGLALLGLIGVAFAVLLLSSLWIPAVSGPWWWPGA